MGNGELQQSEIMDTRYRHTVVDARLLALLCSPEQCVSCVLGARQDPMEQVTPYPNLTRLRSSRFILILITLHCSSSLSLSLSGALSAQSSRSAATPSSSLSATVPSHGKSL